MLVFVGSYMVLTAGLEPLLDLEMPSSPKRRLRVKIRNSNSQGEEDVIDGKNNSAGANDGIGADDKAVADPFWPPERVHMFAAEVTAAVAAGEPNMMKCKRRTLNIKHRTNGVSSSNKLPMF